jgi:phosphate transport system substrate-binding protein
MKRVLGAFAAIVAGLLLLVPSAVAATTVTITGGGADSVDPLMGKWQQAVAKDPLALKVDYSADGSGGGRTDFVSKSVDFAVTSVPFTAAQKQTLADQKRTYVSIPLAAGSIAFLYHLFTPQGDPIKGLQLTGPTIAKIFTGTITNWNDPEIVAENPTLTLPPVRIIPTVRGQASGATYALTSFMKDQAPDVWHAFMADPSRNFPDDPVEEFPFFAGVDSRTSSFAVADVVRSKESSNGRIAYVDTAWAIPATDEGADIAKVKNAAGKFVLPSASNGQVSIDKWAVDSDGHMTPNYRVTDTAAYPLGIVHEIILPTSDLAAEKAAALRAFVQYALKDGQALAAPIGDPRLPEAVTTKALATLDTEIPPTTTTTTSSTTAPPGSTDVLANDATNSSTADGSTLAYTGNPALGWPLVVGGALFVAGTVLRRRRSR